MICLSKRIEKDRDSIEQLVDFSGGVIWVNGFFGKKTEKEH
jgi:hypothetical protein